MSRTGKHITLSLWYNQPDGGPAFPDAPELGTDPHAQTAMRHLGIEYEAAHPFPIGDCWRFFYCTNIPDELPSWMTLIEGEPPEYLVKAYNL